LGLSVSRFFVITMGDRLRVPRGHAMGRHNSARIVGVVEWLDCGGIEGGRTGRGGGYRDDEITGGAIGWDSGMPGWRNSGMV